MTSIVIPVLLYHSVSDRPRENGSWGAVSRAAFAAHVDAIDASGRQAIDISTLAGALRAERPLPERAVAITFDDGYADTYEAVELLGRHALACTVYVTTGQIGGLGRLSAQQVGALARLPGVEVGSHAVHHRWLDELNGHELVDELRDSKAQLQELTGGRIDSFAYPHGAYDWPVRDAVIAAGYRSAAAVKNAVSHWGDDPFAIARWTVTAATSAASIAEVLEGKGVPPAWTGERLRTRAFRTFRRQRRRLFGARSASC